MIAGNQGLRPKASWAARKINGAPSTADVPGGVGNTLGNAKMNSNAPMARSAKAASRSPMETRSRIGSSASTRKISDSGSLPAVTVMPGFKIPSDTQSVPPKRSWMKPMKFFDRLPLTSRHLFRFTFIQGEGDAHQFDAAIRCLDDIEAEIAKPEKLADVGDSILLGKQQTRQGCIVIIWAD